MSRYANSAARALSTRKYETRFAQRLQSGHKLLIAGLTIPAAT